MRCDTRSPCFSRSVAAKFLLPMEILGADDDPVRVGCVDFFPYSFEVVGKVSGDFQRNEKRASYTTPKTFLELLKLYTGMLGGKVEALEDKKNRLTNGLEKLKATQEQVAGLEVVLTEKAEVVKVKVAEAEVKAEEVGIEKEKVQSETEKANNEAVSCGEISKRVNIQKASCEKDLAAALPLVAQAEAALDVLNKKDFQELKSAARARGRLQKPFTLVGTAAVNFWLYTCIKDNVRYFLRSRFEGVLVTNPLCVICKVAREAAGWRRQSRRVRDPHVRWHRPERRSRQEGARQGHLVEGRAEDHGGTGQVPRELEVTERVTF